MRHKRFALRFTIPLFIFSVLMASALFAPFLAPHNPVELHLEQGLALPSWAHPLGQDKLGRDLLSRILYGGRVSLGISSAVLVLTLMVGVGIGALAGFSGGRIDAFLMRLTDIFLAFPGILLAIAIAAVLDHSVLNIVLALSVGGWAGFARITRGQLLVVREADYILAARAMGSRPVKMILKHLLPNIAAPLLVEAVFQMGTVILAEASLSFLGLGVQPPHPSWGGMLNEARSFLWVAPRLTIVPSLVIIITLLTMNLLGDSLRDLLDVQS